MASTTISFLFSANGLIALAALLFVLGYLSNLTSAGSGNGFIALGAIFGFLWFVLQLVKYL